MIPLLDAPDQQQDQSPLNKAAKLMKMVSGGLPAAAAATSAPAPDNSIPPDIPLFASPAPDISTAPPFVNALNLPFLPGYKPPQPARPPLTTPTGQMVPGLNWKQRLQVLGNAAVRGALAGQAASEQAVIQSGGRRSGGVGTGFMAGLEDPARQTMLQQQIQRGGLENQILGAQAQFAPQAQVLNFSKTMADIQKNLADAGKATAEAGAIPMKSALEAAQALAQRYKEDAGSGQLIDLQTGQPFGNSTGIAPLTADEAVVLGKQEGDRVPIKLKNTASEIVNRGIHSVSANGRQLLVDSAGRTIKDLGASSAMVNFNLQGGNTQFDENDPQVQAVANGRMKIQDVLTPRTPLPVRKRFLAAVLNSNPNFDSSQFDIEKGVATKATSGSWADTRVAYNTALDHSQQLLGALTALDNGNVQKLNSLKNYFKTNFGSPDVSTYAAIANAYNHEVTSVVSKGHMTDAEVKTGGAVLPSNASPQQIRSTVNAYNALMQSKRDELNKMIKAGAGNKANSVLGVGQNQSSGFDWNAHPVAQ